MRLDFHGDLDFFLRSRMHGRPVERTLTEKTSIKDVIESGGVPHPEVDLIVVDGEPVDFNFGISRDAEIEVYPPGILYSLFKEKRLQLARATRFVCDGHLGRLTRDLRLLGFDVAYDQNANDQQLLRIMQAEDRALLTRDRRLLMHAIVRSGYCPRSQNPNEQTIEVIRRFDLLASIGPFTRCIRCNGSLQNVPKTDVVEKLEPLTKIYYQQFRRCTRCGQIYWSGSHFTKLQKRLEQICANCTG